MENENPLISVIIPVYKVEKYLDKCVESATRQLYNNIEIILVDDGSPDNCPEICDVWAEKDERIRVIHKNNGGLSSARNAGLDVMKGKYVYFVDSDDEIEPDALTVLYSALTQNDCDMAIGRYQRKFEDKGREKEIIQPPFTGEIKILNEDSFWNFYYNTFADKNLYEYSVNLVISCNKLIKSSIFDDLRFELNKLNEDEIIISDIVSKCGKIVFVDKYLYTYNIRGNSIMESVFSFEDKRNELEMRRNRVLRFAKNNKSYTLKAFSHYFYVFEWMCIVYSRSGKGDMKKLIKEYKGLYKTIVPFLNDASPKEKALYKCLYMNPSLFLKTYYLKYKKSFDKAIKEAKQ